MTGHILRGFDVSRETIERLIAYENLLRKWNGRINLVSPKTLDDAWARHIEDSAQLLSFAGAGIRKWVDLGSGAGFPGLVIAAILKEESPNTAFTLIESDQRKSAFLRTVIRELSLNAKVLNQRIEDAVPQNAQIVSARALAPLDVLLPLVRQHCAPGGKALLPKGANWKKEVDNARRLWSFDHVSHKSVTDPNAVILEIGDIAHV